METKRKGGMINVWFFTTIILVIAIAFILYFKRENNSYIGADGKAYPEIDKTEATNVFTKFVTEAYGQQFDNIAVDGVNEESGLYKITVTFQRSGESASGDLYLTKDAQLFFPQAIPVEGTLEKARQLKEASEKQPNTSTTTPEIKDNATSTTP